MSQFDWDKHILVYWVAWRDHSLNKDMNRMKIGRRRRSHFNYVTMMIASLFFKYSLMAFFSLSFPSSFIPCEKSHSMVFLLIKDSMLVEKKISDCQLWGFISFCFMHNIAICTVIHHRLLAWPGRAYFRHRVWFCYNISSIQCASLKPY